MRKILCEVFKSRHKEEVYLYVEKTNGLADVPEVLLEHFGDPVPVMTMLLSEDKPLARADAGQVIGAIAEKGFYLQMPPAKDEYLLDLYRTPTKAFY